jgi:hypothetical protein
MLKHPIVQIAYFVGDAKQAAIDMADRVGAGPFFLIERIELAWAEHRGQPRKFLHTSAYGQWGSLMIEFVQQDEEGPSPFRDLYRPGQQGIHHVAMMVDSLPETYRYCEQQELAIAAKAQTLSGTEFAFVDTAATLGHMIEIYQRSAQLIGFYDLVRAASVGWDGREPVRTLR